MSRRPFGWLATIFLLVSLGPAAAEEYRLGPDDQLRVRAVAWNEAERRFDNWAVVSGEFAVQSDGTVSIPLAGAVEAEGLTTAELSVAMAELLEARGGMIESPTIAIEVIGYRPFYVLGDVARPGAYPARPGLTVLQAVALAGGGSEGLEEGSDIRGSIREAGALRETLNQTSRARAREARLVAEVAKEDAVTFPETLRHPDGPEAMARIREEERAIFTARKAALERELAALEDLKELLAVEVEGLEKKLQGQAEQIRLARQNVDNLSGLVERGFARAPQLADAQRGLIDLEGKETDLQNNIYRARQRITENDRDIIELSARRETQATIELQEIRARLEDLETRKGVLEQVVVANGLDAQLADLGDLVTRYSVVRAGEEHGSAIGPGARIHPGDVLTVTTELEDGTELIQ